jgi:hypothetical protein
MKLFRDFLEECIGKKILICFSGFKETTEELLLKSVEVDFLCVEYIGNGSIGYIPIRAIDTLFILDAQNSEN